MPNTVGFGMAMSGWNGIEDAIQQAIVRDGTIFVLGDGVSATDLSGPGCFSYVGSLASAGMIFNSDGEVIAVQGGLLSKASIGFGNTTTTEVQYSRFEPVIGMSCDRNLHLNRNLQEN